MNGKRPKGAVRASSKHHHGSCPLPRQGIDPAVEEASKLRFDVFCLLQLICDTTKVTPQRIERKQKMGIWDNNVNFASGSHGFSGGKC